MTPTNICLIGGSGRSGTTILKDTFFQHPDVAGLGHSRFLTDPDGLIDFFNTFSSGWSPYLYDVKIRRLEQLLRAAGETRLWKRALHALNRRTYPRGCPYIVCPPYAHASVARDCPGYSRFVGELLADLTEFAYRGYWGGSHFLQKAQLVYRSPVSPAELAAPLGAFVRKVARDVVERKGAKHFVEDSPWNLLFFDQILKLLPDARMVHIYRDPRDAVSSYMFQTWSPSDPIEATRFYLGVMERWAAVRAVIPGDSYREISLERFVATPKAVLEEICDFWGIRWDASLLTTDLGHSHAARWTRDLPAATRQTIQGMLREHVTALGYDQ